MKKTKVVQYTAVCSRPVAEEMTRYEGSKIVKEEPALNRHPWKDPYMAAQNTNYTFTIEADKNRYRPGRWSSFGIKTTVIPEVSSLVKGLIG